MLREKYMKHWLHPRTLPRFVRFVYHSFMHHQGLEVAKSLTYTSLFAVVPLFTLLMAILAAFPSFQGYAGQIQALLESDLGGGGHAVGHSRADAAQH
jgi:uncharacterized BrkB/YihY/UPF0761 family membrane protein